MDNKRPSISIVITNYNKGKFIDRAIRSCLSQLVIQRLSKSLLLMIVQQIIQCKYLRSFSSSIKIIKNSKK